MMDLTPYIEQVGLVPDNTICTISIDLLREFVERIERAEFLIAHIEDILDGVEHCVCQAINDAITRAGQSK